MIRYTIAGVVLLAGCSSASPQGWGSTTDTGDPSSSGGSSGSSGSSSSSSPTPDAGAGTQDAQGTAQEAAASPESGAPGCLYPAGPYGKQVGDIVDPSLSWQGYAPGATAPSTVQVTQLYDCDGTKGIRALFFDESALWCGACQQLAAALGPESSAWAQEGMVLVTLVAEDANQQPATTAAALTWQQTYGLGWAITLADPNDTLARYGIDPSSGAENGLPTDVIIDPRTMKIVAVQPTDPSGTLTTLAQQNGAP